VLTDIKIEGRPRSLKGRRISRKLGRQGLVPGIVYGGDQPPEMFVIDPRTLDRIRHSAGGLTTLFRFTIEGKKDEPVVIIKEIQEDPVSGYLLHADLMRISMDRPLQVKIPLHLTGTPRGVKQQGGVLDFVMREIEISCLPGDMPERLEIDVSELEIGHSLKVEDLTVPERVTVHTDAHAPVATVVTPAAEKAQAAAEAEPEVEEGAEPEVIQKGKAEEEKEAGEESPEEKGGS
jgi:large subunit ribosomal protein L25